jgi:pyrroline-5-carboxylate reductase
VLALRPQVAAEAISTLRFAPQKPIISLIAGLQIEQLAAWTGAASICRAVPLPFVETRQGVTPVFPPAPEAMALFGALGQAIVVESLADFDVYAAGSALMGSYFGMVETAESWMVGQGLPRVDAAVYLRALFGSLGDTLRQNPADLTELRIGHSTKGGLNERGHQVFEAEGGARALTAALDAILTRIATLRAGT